MIAAIGTNRRRPSRFFAESDGDPHAKTFYVTHTTRSYHEPCSSRREAQRRATELNELDRLYAVERAREAVREIANHVYFGRETDAMRILDQYSLNRYE